MNPLTKIKNTQKATDLELKLGLSESASWHAQFKHSAYIYIGGLSFDLTEGDVLAVFAQYGEIVDVHLVRDKTSGKSRGFAFVAYEDQRSTVLAVDNLNGARVAGRTVRVEHVDNYKKKKEEVEGPDAAAPGAPASNGVQQQQPREPDPDRDIGGPANGGGAHDKDVPDFVGGGGGGGLSMAELLAEGARRRAEQEAKRKAGPEGEGPDKKKHKKQKKEKKDKKSKKDKHSKKDKGYSDSDDGSDSSLDHRRPSSHQRHDNGNDRGVSTARHKDEPSREEASVAKSGSFGPPRPGGFGPPKPAAATRSQENDRDRSKDDPGDRARYRGDGDRDRGDGHRSASRPEKQQQRPEDSDRDRDGGSRDRYDDDRRRDSRKADDEDHDRSRHGGTGDRYRDAGRDHGDRGRGRDERDHDRSRHNDDRRRDRSRDRDRY